VSKYHAMNVCNGSGGKATRGFTLALVGGKCSKTGCGNFTEGERLPVPVGYENL